MCVCVIACRCVGVRVQPHQLRLISVIKPWQIFIPATFSLLAPTLCSHPCSTVTIWLFLRALPFGFWASVGLEHPINIKAHAMQETWQKQIKTVKYNAAVLDLWWDLAHFLQSLPWHQSIIMSYRCYWASWQCSSLMHVHLLSPDIFVLLTFVLLSFTGHDWFPLPSNCKVQKAINIKLHESPPETQLGPAALWPRLHITLAAQHIWSPAANTPDSSDISANYHFV